MIKVIIPAAGLGTRLKPFTHTIPKALLPVAGKPIISHIVDQFAGQGIDDFVFVVGYMGQKIEEYIRANYTISTSFAYQEELLGLGYAIHLGLSFVSDDDTVVILLGDTITEVDFSRIFDIGGNVIGVHPVLDPRRFGIVTVKDGRIVEFVEKPEHPRSNLGIVGLYLIRDTALLRRSLREIIETNKKTRGEFQLTDALAMMLSSGVEFFPYEISGWFDCGSPETLLETNRHILATVDSSPAIEGSVIIPPCFISPDAVVKSSIIGPYVSIAAGSSVEGSIVRDSILAEAVHLKHCLLESSILGTGAEFVGRFYRLNMGDSSQVILDWGKEK